MRSSPSATHNWPRAVVFDLDGTLVDSAPDIANAVNQTLAGHAIKIDADEARRYLGDGARRLLERILEARAWLIDPADLSRLVERFENCYGARPCVDSRSYPGAESALARLKTRGVGLAICTNKPQPVADQVIARLALDRYIDVVVGAGSYALKPDPEPLRACLGKLGCKPADALYIGDMMVDRDAGRAAGLTVLIADFGYSSRPASEIGADGVLADWPRLESAIARLNNAPRASRLGSVKTDE